MNFNFLSLIFFSSLVDFRDKENLIDCKKNIYQVIENNKFSSQNLEKVQEYLHRISQQQV